jgi:hypothetical protein
MPRNSRLLEFHPADAIAVLTGTRKQHFPAERELALIGFGAWVRFPNNARLVCATQILAAANYLLNLPTASRSRWVSSNPFCSQEAFARCLLDYPIEATDICDWSELELNEMFDILEVIDFFMKCPSEQKPSLLKAIYFIEHGGFASDEHDWRRSSTTLKSAWTKLGVSGPFIWAANFEGFESILDLSPTAPASIRRVAKLLSRKQALHDFFGLAKFCQDHLVRRLDKRSLDRFDFVDFPPNIAPLELELDALTRSQIDLLKNYRAPKLI